MRISSMESLASQRMDFLPRERQNALTRLLLIFLFVILLIFAVGYVPDVFGLQAYLPIISIIAIALVGIYVVTSRQIDLDLVTAAEFQNLLYSQAAGVGSDFYILTRRDGTIVHASEGMTRVFPRFDYSASQALDGLFEQGTVRKVDRERVMDAIFSGTTDRLIFPVFNSYDQQKNFILTVDPLPRPSGFVMLRAREYLGQRAGAQLLPDMLRATSVDKLDHLLSHTSVGLYTTNGYGQIEYVNPTFERILGYAPGQMIEAKLSLHHIIFSLGTASIMEEYTPTDYQGEAMMVLNGGEHRRHIITQTAMRDSEGRLAGVTGTLYPAISSR